MIEIKLTFQTLEEAAPYLSAIAAVKGLDTSARGVKSEPVAPVSTGEVMAGVTGGAQAPARRAPRHATVGKAEGVAGEAQTPAHTGDTTSGASDERVSEDAGAATPTSDIPDVSAIVDMLMNKFHGGDSEMKAKIKAWRDSMGIGRMVDMKPEQAGDAYQFYLSL